MLRCGQLIDTYDSDDVAEWFRSAWETTAQLCEWALCVVDRVIKVLESMPKASKKASQARAGFSFGSLPAQMLAMFVEALFSQMSPELYKMVRLCFSFELACVPMAMMRRAVGAIAGLATEGLWGRCDMLCPLRARSFKVDCLRVCFLGIDRPSRSW